MKTKLILAVCGVFLVAGASIATAQGLRQRAGEGGGRLHQRFERFQRAQRFLQQHRGEIGRRLGVTEDQKALARNIAQQIRPIADTLRPQIMATLARAREAARGGDREGARAILKNQLKPLIEQARTQARPLVQPLIQSLTPEQRAKIEAWAKARGRTLDDGKLADRIAMHLAHVGRGARR